MPISLIFLLLNYSPLLHQQNLMWNKDLTYYNNIVWCEIKYYLLQRHISMYNNDFLLQHISILHNNYYYKFILM